MADDDKTFEMACKRRREQIKGGLRAERNRVNLSQAALGAAIHVPQSTISNWEKGDGSIGFEEALRLAEYYGITLDQLAGRTHVVPQVAI